VTRGAPVRIGGVRARSHGPLEFSPGQGMPEARPAASESTGFGHTLSAPTRARCRSRCGMPVDGSRNQPFALVYHGNALRTGPADTEKKPERAITCPASVTPLTLARVRRLCVPRLPQVCLCRPYCPRWKRPVPPGTSTDSAFGSSIQQLISSATLPYNAITRFAVYSSNCPPGALVRRPRIGQKY